MGSTNKDAKSRENLKANLQSSEVANQVDPATLKSQEPEDEQKGKKSTPKIDIVGANARVRNDSECSTGSPKSPSVNQMKKQRVLAGGTSPVQNFIFPGVPASPPKFMSLDEVMKAANGVSNMILAHEIAVDKNFKLEKFEPPANSIQKKVRDTMHKAFWDNMREQLAEEPQVYTQTFVLLKEVRDDLLGITLPHQTRLRQEITDKFDVDLIKQQAEHGVLNFSEYSRCVLSIMGQLCAPVRDEAIKKLMSIEDPVEVFKGVMELLDLMKLDMANFTIQQIRPQVIAQSVEYERNKFAEYLETQNDGLEITREWLLKHIEADDVDSYNDSNAKAVVNKIMARSYLYLLTWPADKLLPETIVLDGTRFLELGDRLKQVCIIGSMLLVTLSSLGPKFPDIENFKMKLKKNVCIILDTASTEEETLNLTDNAVEQIISDVTQYLKDCNQTPLTPAAITALKSQLVETKNPEQRIRQLITSRAYEFIGLLLNSTIARPIQVPLGLSSLQEELAHICGTLLRIVMHNKEVFGSYYADIIAKHIKSQRSIAAELDLD